MTGIRNSPRNESACIDFQEKWLRTYYDEIGAPTVFVADRMWHSTGSKTFIPLPCSAPMTVSQREKDLLWKSGAVFLKYPVESGSYGYPSYLYLVSDKQYDLDTLARHVRKETERALRKCNVEQIPVKDILSAAPSIISDTYSRQDRQFSDSILREWMNNIEAAAHNPLFECWAVYVGNQVGAFRIDFTYRGGFYGDVLFNVKELLKYQVMNALMFVSTREVIKRPHIDHVSYGIRSIFGDKPTLNKFKESMGYEKIPLYERIEISPGYRFLITPGAARIGLRLLQYISPRFHKVQKLEAILGMYAQQRGDDI